jgi:hypothetical protein
VLLSVREEGGAEVLLSVREEAGAEVLLSVRKKQVLNWFRFSGRSEEILLFSIRKNHFLKWNYLSGKRQVLTTTRRRLPRATPSYRRPTRGGRQAA